jgi:GNAT superfamily N-acetyltransferase
MKIIRTNPQNKDFINLVKELDAYLKITDEDEHGFYNQFNNIDVLKEVILAYNDGAVVGCGAIKKFDNISAEVKRMYVSKEYRGKGFAKNILKELEIWAKELDFKKCVLETGKRQVEAVHFYHKCNYKVIPNYGQYTGMENSICFEKKL